MRRVFFVFLIVIVLGVIGFCAWNEFSVKSIVFVNDKTIRNNPDGNAITIYRLYNSGIDIDGFNKNVQANIINTEFTEDEIEAAAIAAGNPELYEAFDLSIINETDMINGSRIAFRASTAQLIAPNQDETNYKIENLRIEARSEGGITIGDSFETLLDSDIKSKNTPLKSENATELMQPADNTSVSGFFIDGDNGTITINIAYDVCTDSIFKSIVLRGQLLVVVANISTDETGKTTIELIPEKYSSIEDLTN